MRQTATNTSPQKKIVSKPAYTSYHKSLPFIHLSTLKISMSTNIATDMSYNPQPLNNPNIMSDTSRHENDLVLGIRHTSDAFNDFGLTVVAFTNNNIKKFDGYKIYNWNINTNKSIYQPIILKNQKHRISKVWFFDNYTIIYSFDYDVDIDRFTYTLQVWDAALEVYFYSLINHTDIFSIIIHNNLLITGSEDKIIRIFDITTGVNIKYLKGHKGLVDILIAKDNLLISSSCEDETIKVWDITTGACIKTYTCQETYVWSMHLIANTLVCGMENGIIQLLDIKIGDKLLTEIITLDARNTNYTRTGISSVYATNEIIISADTNQYIKFWDMNTYKLIYKYKNPYKVKDIYMSDNTPIFISDTHEVIAEPITLFLGEYNKINDVVDAYNLAPHLDREIMAYFSAK